MKRTQRQKGFILLLVVALIPLLGMAAVVLTANSRQLLTQTRRHAVAVRAQQAAESGISWLNTRGPEAVADNKPVVLHIEHKDPIITCRIERTGETAGRSVFTVTGTAEDKRFSSTHAQQFILNH